MTRAHVHTLGAYSPRLVLFALVWGHANVIDPGVSSHGPPATGWAHPEEAPARLLQIVGAKVI